jgi:hypothetical protein
MFAIEVAAMAPLASAYVAAGYADTPWAMYNANRLAHTPEVAARIDELLTQFAERSGIYAEYIQRKLLPIVEANHADLFEGDRLKPIDSLPRTLSAAISKVKVDESGAVVEIALADKIAAGNVLLRSLGSIREGGEAANVNISQVTRVIVATPPVSAPAVVPDSTTERLAAVMKKLGVTAGA